MVYEAQTSVKIAKATACLNFVKFEESDGFLAAGKQPFIFAKISQLLQLVNEDYQAHMVHMTDELAQRIPTKQRLETEAEFLERHLVDYTKEKGSRIVFCHNDLLMGNIIYNRAEQSVKFIDYEYGEFNYQV